MRYQSGTGGSQLNFLTAVGNVLYFRLWTARTGAELWKSDGTEAGTVMVRDIRPGSQGSAPAALYAAGDVLYFRADDGAHGQELWRSAGTEATTILLSDINPSAGSNPQSMRLLGDTLLVTADDGSSGRELWSVSTTNSAPVAGAGGTYVGPEGSAIALSGTAGDPDGDTLEVLWSVNSPRCSFIIANADHHNVPTMATPITLRPLTRLALDTDVTQLTVNNAARDPVS